MSKRVSDNELLSALLSNGSPTATANQLGISVTTVLSRIKWEI